MLKKISLTIGSLVIVLGLIAVFLFKTGVGQGLLLKVSGHQALTSAQMEEEIDKVYVLLKEHAQSKVFLDYELTKHNIVIVEIDDATGEKINAWSLNTNEKTNLTKDEIDNIEAPAIGGYNSLFFRGKDSIVLSTSKSTLPLLNSVLPVNYLYEIATHEMYHFYYDPIERYEKLGKAAQDRYTIFPKQVLPRVYRKMVYINLVGAYNHPQDETSYLGQAKYWYEMWVREFPNEHESSYVTDIAEGKARYVENMLALSVDDEEKAQSQIKKMIFINDKLFDDISSESYELGFISGLLLDTQSPSWKEKINKTNERPVEMLLADVQPIQGDQKEFDKILKKAGKKIEKDNEKIQVKLENIDLAENDTNIAFLSIDNKFSSGSFSVSDFISYMGNVICLDFSADFTSGMDKIKLKSISVYQSQESDAYILPLTMDYKLENGYIILDDSKAQGKIKVKETKNNDGRLVYIME